MDDFTRGYLDALLWSECHYSEGDNNPGSFDSLGYTIDDLSPETLAQAVEDCAKFQADNAEDLAEFGELVATPPDCTEDEYAGHDFALTRNEHGAGFWTHAGAYDVGDRLTEACNRYGKVTLYLGDGDLEALWDDGDRFLIGRDEVAPEGLE